MLKKIAIIAVVLIALPIAAVLAFAATKPDTFQVERATSIEAPPERIFALINDFHSWGAWSPYEHKDPAMKRTFSGAANGKGAVYEWEGNSDVGKGRMEITEASPPVQGHARSGFRQAVRGAQHRRVQVGASRRLHEGNLDHERSRSLLCEGRPCALRYGRAWSARTSKAVSPT